MATIAPKIFWCRELPPDSGNMIPLQSKLDFGAIKSGQGMQGERLLYIWNNWKGETDVADITNCYLTVKMRDGTSPTVEGDNPLVFNKWIHIKNLSAVPADQEGTVSYPAEGLGGKAESLETLAVGARNQAAGVIKGTANNGALTNSQNYCKIKIALDVPATARGGVIDFVIRLGYQFS